MESNRSHAPVAVLLPTVCEQRVEMKTTSPWNLKKSAGNLSTKTTA